MPNNQELRRLLLEAFSPQGIKPSHLPDIDLYIDQILTIFEEKLSSSRRSEKEKPLTKAMVNNYSKEKLLTPMKGKTYSREQVLELLTVVQLKNALPIAGIKNVLDNLRADGWDKKALAALLETNDSAQAAQQAVHSLDSLLPPAAAELSQKELLGLLLSMSRLSALYKRACEMVTDAYFPPVSPENKKERREKS